MAPEFMFVKDAADMAKDLGPYGVIGLLIYLLKVQKEGNDKRETAWIAKLEDYAKGSKSDLTQMIEVSTRSNTAWQTATSTLEKLSGVIQGAKELLQVIPLQLDRNFDRINVAAIAAATAVTAAEKAAAAAASDRHPPTRNGARP